ncbi:PTS fructose transporter subunit IIABC [Bacillus benzoevorans]|uniref:PTS system fructose-specific IIC component n=1 Tax=Bacillus benzoevorans TaxID=1456 RepID=A0A7X0HRQ8_9BACI|nr:fructose-specific PTS transporter subunit EIIC [Bacillus benzoevorans]MBB6444336.1 PTS system fructose-specific IIC component [Bacillus benzoevorans]
MKIIELLTKDTIALSLNGTQKSEAIEQLVHMLDCAGRLTDKAEFKQAILAREEQCTTGIGEGIAIPHAKTKAAKQSAIAFARSKRGVSFESLDGQPVFLFFMIAAPEGANNTHLEVLSRLSTLLLNKDVRQRLLEAASEDEVLAIINTHDTEDNEVDQSLTGKEKLIAAVTACPTGIAHTYMAADSLKAKAAEMGIDIKVETRGASGAQNVLTAEDIENAAAVIIAADITIEMDRFNGKHVLETSVADGIRKPQELLERALQQDAPIYQENRKVIKETKGRKKGTRRGMSAAIYKHLLNGVSNMLPFAIGGGILIAVSLMFGYHAADPADPSYHPIAGILMTIGGGSAFGLIIPVLAGFIAMSIADRPGLAPGMAGGILAASAGAGFLGGLAAGFLAGYVVVGWKKALAGLPSSIEGMKTILLYPVLGMALTGLMMIFVLNQPIEFINSTMTEWFSGLHTGTAVLLGMILGLMMSFDMGGPINKTAYVFGIGLLINGVFEPMAAIMAAGMVPPLATALATTLFKKKFSTADQKAGKTNYMKGLSFMTEGAASFAAADPTRMIPAIMTGSAIAAALSMLFGIGLRIPHGGIFVIPLVDGNPLLYLLAIAVGAIVSALLIGFSKKPVQQET